MADWSEYLGYGWRLCELRPGTKAPRDPGWQKQGAPFNEAALGAGLVHQWSGTCALDVDDYDKARAWLAERGIDLDALFTAPDAVQILSGRSNHGKLLYALPEALRSKKVIEAKKNILDFRCIGNQDVLPPSIHPDTGRPYRWLGDPMLGLPALPTALEALWRSLLAPATDAPAKEPTPASEAELAELLASRDPDCDYLEWLKVGMAVHAATKGQGFYIWDNWARRGAKYSVPAEGSGLVGVAHLMSKWRSFHADGGVGVESLRAAKVAAPDEFPPETASTPPAPLGNPAAMDEYAEGLGDDTPFGRARALLGNRMVYLTGQDRFWLLPGEPAIPNLDEHLDCAVRGEALDNFFLGHMPEFPSTSKAGVTTMQRRKPLEFWRTNLPNDEKLMVRAPSYHPGEGRVFVDGDGERYLNLYKPYSVKPVRPTAANIEAWERLLARIEDANYRRWLLQYFAFALKHPGVKIATAPLLHGNPGTGKGTLMATVPRLLYGVNNVTPMSNEVLNSDFNDLLCNNWFITFDELKTEGGKKDRITLSNKVKEWITEPYITLHPKGLKPYKVPNRLQFTASTNFDDALHIENDDRRWAVCEMTGSNMSDQEAADLYEGFLKAPDAAGKLRWIFDQVNLVGFSPTGKPPRTAARAEMVRASFGAWTTRLLELLTSGAPPFDRDAVTGIGVRDALMGVNAPSLYRVGSVLKRAGIATAKIHTVSGDLHVWRNIAGWRQQPHRALWDHLSTGARPLGVWTNEVPLAIRRLTGDDGGPDDVTDLLGDSNA